MMKRTPAFILAAFVLGWWGISMTRSLSLSKSSEERVALEEPSAQDADAAAEATPAAGGPDSARKPAAISPAPARVEPAPKPMPKFEYQSELNSYAQLKTKVLPSPEEEAARGALLKNALFLRSLGERLTKTPLLPLGEQDVALDLLVDALKNGDKSTAEAAITDIVSDKQVEDAAIPQPVREQLAGIKAELLYHWTALEPDQAAQVAHLLPGQVSRKIWNNVTEAQKNNLAEGH